MGTRRMHADEMATDVGLVRRLLAGQFPQWADLPARPVPSSGTDNALYRLGDDLVVRLPRIGLAVTAFAG
jgi:aminoglycoside phosphotransferase (APT) family kinase protein